MNAPFTTAEDETVELGALNESVGFMLRMTQTRAYDQFFRDFAGTDVRPGEYTVLQVVGMNPGLKQGSLARTLNIKPAHMTKLVQRLVRAGHLKRTVPPEDRRSVRLELTQAGQAHVDRHHKRFLSVHRAERIGLTDAENAALLALLKKLSFNEGPECP
ncbi:MarR family winged helix-turn-helix transcriptional regulator [Pararhodobacter sp.]|uniref:MarR family winged helix-turn-helix transcriptional regulator n=1 Tax=Pararhodobacter sp. TaxID=2127056 RepID=UPI002AFE27A4|nr:MarR family transcriptional regulator [Pararhodobacter sp.]